MKTLIILAICFCSVFSYGQDNSRRSSNRAAQKAYEDANRYISDNSTYEAIKSLREALKLDAKFTAAWQQLGDLYRKQQDYNAAKECYRRVIFTNPVFYAATYFGLGASELNTGDYQDALIHFKRYAATPNLSEQSKKITAKYITDCEYSLLAIQNPVTFKPQNAGKGINSPEHEYLPVVTADEETLIFTRRANNNEDFFKSTKKDGVWDSSVYLSKNINSLTTNEGAQYISPDGLYLFFTGCNRPDGMGRCDIYVSRREGKDWGSPHNIGAPVNTAGWESQPSLSADGSTLYFTSLRAGGLGGYDIWKSSLLAGGTWTEPQNLGPEINTPYDEQSPFIHPDDQTLYFSSNGWPGLGNKDVFLSRKDALGRWQRSKNLGYPINSFKEESSLSISTNGQTAFFASDQEGGLGGLDIYTFELPAELQPMPVSYLKGIVYDQATKQPLDAAISVINVKTGKILYGDLADYESGEFLVPFVAGQTIALYASKENYLFYSENFLIEDSRSALKPYKIEVPLQKIETGKNVALRNIFFETNKFELLPESKTELEKLVSFLNTNPKTVIEIQGHTDNEGDAMVNQILSEKRAISVYKYLIYRNIMPFRLSIKGYGKTNPTADNATEEGRKKNRRTEFLVLGN